MSYPSPKAVLAEDCSYTVLPSWLLPVYFGNPKQLFYLLPDSGANDLGVLSTLDTALAKAKVHPPLYDPSKSSTRKLLQGYTFDQGFGSGYEWSGVVYTDRFQIGSLVIENQAIQVATKESTQSQDGPRSGAIGFNPDPYGLSTSPKRLPNWWQNAKSSLKQQLFAVDYHFFGQKGTFDLGFIDTSKYTGTLDYQPVVKGATQWYVEVAGIYSAKYGKSSYRTNVTIDTGTGGSSFNFGLLTLWFSFNIPGSKFSSSLNTWTYPCNFSRPDFNFLYGPNKVRWRISLKSCGFYDKAEIMTD